MDRHNRDMLKTAPRSDDATSEIVQQDLLDPLEPLPLHRRALFVPGLLCDVISTLVTSRRWWDRIDDRIVLGALPIARHAQQLRALGVRRVINMCSEYAGPRAAYDRLGISQLRLPTHDFTPPTLAAVEAAMRFIEQVESETDVVYVHCKAGRGRSPTVVLCWLMLSQGLSADEAEAQLRAIRPHIDQNLSRRTVVQAFANARRCEIAARARRRSA